MHGNDSFPRAAVGLHYVYVKLPNTRLWRVFKSHLGEDKHLRIDNTNTVHSPPHLNS